MWRIHGRPRRPGVAGNVVDVTGRVRIGCAAFEQRPREGRLARRMCARRIPTGPQGRRATAKDVVLAANVTRPRHAVGNRQWRHRRPGITHDVVPVMIGRAHPAPVTAHQVDELAGDGRVGRAFAHRRSGTAGVPGIRHRVVFPSLTLLHEARVQAADDVDLAVARVVDSFGPDAGGRHGCASGPRVRRHIVDVGRTHDNTAVKAAEDVNLVHVRGIRCPRVIQGHGHTCQRRPGVRHRIVSINSICSYA